MGAFQVFYVWPIHIKNGAQSLYRGMVVSYEDENSLASTVPSLHLSDIRTTVSHVAKVKCLNYLVRTFGVRKLLRTLVRTPVAALPRLIHKCRLTVAPRTTCLRSAISFITGRCQRSTGKCGVLNSNSGPGVCVKPIVHLWCWFNAECLSDTCKLSRRLLGLACVRSSMLMLLNRAVWWGDAYTE